MSLTGFQKNFTLLAKASFWSTKSFASLVFRVVGLFTSQRETSNTSRLHFPLSRGFKYLQILGGISRDEQLKTGVNEFVNSCASIFIDLLCKNEPAWSRKMAGKGLSRLCFNAAVQKSLKALENYTIKSLTPSHSKTLYSVLYGVLCTRKNGCGIVSGEIYVIISRVAWLRSSACSTGNAGGSSHRFVLGKGCC